MSLIRSILSLVAPVGLLRLYAGGGDGGAGEMRREEEERQRKVQAAVDQINAMFGAGGGAAAPAPDRAKFVRPGTPGQFVQTGHGEEGNVGYNLPGSPETFDEAAYNKAVADHQASAASIAGNKAIRDRGYADLAEAVKATAMRDLDRQFGKAQKQNVFGLARSGLTGGSVDAESKGELAEMYGEGRLKATMAGTQAAAELRTQDERTRQNLIGMAQSGLDTGTAGSMAAEQLSAASQAARAGAQQATVGNLFANMGQAYLTNQTLRGRYPNGLPQAPAGYSSNVWNPTQRAATGQIQR